MRIALVTNLYPPIQTGTAHWTRELAYHLARAGHAVVVITCAVKGSDEEFDPGRIWYTLLSTQAAVGSAGFPL